MFEEAVFYVAWPQCSVFTERDCVRTIYIFYEILSGMFYPREAIKGAKYDEWDVKGVFPRLVIYQVLPLTA